MPRPENFLAMESASVLRFDQSVRGMNTVPAFDLVPPPMMSLPAMTKTRSTPGSCLIIVWNCSPVARVRCRLAPLGSIRALIR